MFNLLLINYHSWDDIYYIVQEFYKSDFVATIVIVDNSHEKSSLIRFVEFMDKVIILSALSNSGYSGGNNLGLWALNENGISGDIIVSNSDILISNKVVAYAKEVFDNHIEIGQLFFETSDSEGKLMYNSINLNGLSQTWNTNKCECELNLSSYAAGSFFFIRRNIVDMDRHIFDEQYFMYWEEVDLSLRVKDYGYQVICSNHYGVTRASNPLSSTVNSLYYIVRNAFIIKSKLDVNIFNLSVFLFRMLLMSTKLSIKTLELRPFLMFFIGMVHGFKGISGKNEKIHK